ncbi:MAG: vitamin K epoxide reductase family protein, partial [Syntrophales bacterium]|nr:vitamin K epoxide reductase family protein [Syntrophales bacterium]
MQKVRTTAKRLFPIVSFTGLAIVIIELFMQLFGTSVCPTEGCRVVAQHARYGDIAMLIPGIMVFAALALLSGFNLVLREKRLDWFINIILTAAIAAEGFLVGYQAFRLHTSCTFCLTVFAIFVLLGILRILEGHKEVVSGFAIFIVILGLFSLVLPAVNNNCDCIKNSRLTLFYNDD